MPSRRSVAMTRTAISPRLATRTLANTGRSGPGAWAPVDRAGDERVRAERPAEHAPHRARGLQQRLEVDSGLDAHLVEHRHEILGGDVAGRAGRHGAASELADARLERRAARLQGGEHVRETLPARVVEVG